MWISEAPFKTFSRSAFQFAGSVEIEWSDLVFKSNLPQPPCPPSREPRGQPPGGQSRPRVCSVDLTHALVESDRHGACEIQAPRLGPDRNSQDPVRRILEPSWGQSTTFRAEDQGVAWPELGFGIQPAALGAVRPHPVATEMSDDLAQVVHHAKLQMLPVVQTRSLQVPVVEMETKRSDQPERCARRHTGSSDRAGVGCDLRLEKHNMKERRRLTA